ncbi:hypothetical protein OAB79_01225 [Yoonia sp.]|nr:hypothetical protein [Yoonia sp.]
MFAVKQDQRWTPIDQNRWSLRAYGREVMLESSGGALSADLNQFDEDASLQVQGRIVGRMLIEVYCNGAQIIEDLRSNESFEIAVDLTPYSDAGPVTLEVQFKPAAYGEIRIPRSISTQCNGLQTAAFGLGRQAQKNW